MNDNSFLKEIGRSYIVSSFLPSAFFVSMAVVLFRGFVPEELSKQFSRNSALLGNQWMPVLILTLWVAFFLFSSVDWTIKLYEGYYLPPFLRKTFKWWLELIWHSKQMVNYTEIQQIKSKKKKTKRDEKRYDEIKTQALNELLKLELEAPIESEHLLPTRLGNVLRSSEIYASERYSIEGITIWPRLFAILPRQFVKDLEEKTNHFIFLLNSSLLAYGNALLCWVVGFVGLISRSMPELWFAKILEKNGLFFGYKFITPLEFVLAGALLSGFGYMLYNIAVNAAHDYSLFIRTGFDLYRMDLLKQLKQKLPVDQEEEKQTWAFICEYLIAANRIGINDLNLPYVYYPKQDSPGIEQQFSGKAEADQEAEN